MLFLLRKIRQKLLSSSKLTSYLFYAIGEIILVVIGILIAVQINNWNENRKEMALQSKYYLNIITDLKKDSLLFVDRMEALELTLRHLYIINASIKKPETDRPLARYDRMLYNLEFAPVTLSNQQSTIDQLKDNQIRELINDYFLLQSGTQIAMQEYNQSVVEQSRPYFMSAVDMSAIFHPDTLGFLPNYSVLDEVKVQHLLEQTRGKEVLSYLRVSAGYALEQLRRLLQLNSELIDRLTNQLE